MTLHYVGPSLNLSLKLVKPCLVFITCLKTPFNVFILQHILATQRAHLINANFSYLKPSCRKVEEVSLAVIQSTLL